MNRVEQSQTCKHYYIFASFSVLRQSEPTPNVVLIRLLLPYTFISLIISRRKWFERTEQHFIDSHLVVTKGRMTNKTWHNKTRT